MAARTRMHRRRFLETLACGAAGAALARVPGVSALPLVGTGITNPGNLACRNLVMPCLDRNYRVCEIFLRGGLACFETLWVTYATSDLAGDPGYLNDLNWSDLTDRPVSSNYYLNLTLPLGTPSLGPSAEPLFALGSARPKMRVVAVQHDLLPHEAAVPYALTGTRLGRQTLAGMASAFNAVYSADGGAPASVVFHSQSDVWIPYASATGVHGSEHAPLVVRLGDDAFVANLDRAARGLTPGDGLLSLYQDRYAEAMSFQGEPVRSGALASYASAQRYLADAPTLIPIFEGLDLDVPRRATALHEPCANQNCVRAALEVLSSNRDSGAEPLRYALAIADSNAARKSFDSHDGLVSDVTEHTHAQHYALWQIFDVLREAHADGTWDPDETMVFINTEFGRRQKVAGTPGTEHQPEGYVNVLIGGPVATDGHVGGIDVWSATGVAAGDYTTTDVRAAVAMAAGIDPYQDSVFGESTDFSGSAIDGLVRDARYDVLTDQILGI